MKTCPVCHAHAFSDAGICYGCMYRFSTSSLDRQACAEDADWEPEEANLAERGKRFRTDQMNGSQQMLPVKDSGMQQGRHVEQKGNIVMQDRRGSSSVGEFSSNEQNASRPTAREATLSIASSRESEALRDGRESQDLFDTSGWVVRFELPGGMVPFVGGSSSEQLFSFEGNQTMRYSKDEGVWEKHACPLVISISPARSETGSKAVAPRGGEERGSAEVMPELRRAQVAS